MVIHSMVRTPRWRVFLAPLLCSLCLTLFSALFVVENATAANGNHTGSDTIGISRGFGHYMHLTNDNQNTFRHFPIPNVVPQFGPNTVGFGDLTGGGSDNYLWAHGTSDTSVSKKFRTYSYDLTMSGDSEITDVNTSQCDRTQLVIGDWDGNGRDSAGIYCNGNWRLRNSNTTGNSNYAFSFGGGSDQPIVGDWNRDGVDTIGVYRNGNVYLRNANSAGSSSIQFNYGGSNMLGIAGDWNNDGISTIGVYMQNGQFHLRNSNTTGVAHTVKSYGNGFYFGSWNGYGFDSDFPVTGDYDGG